MTTVTTVQPTIVMPSSKTYVEKMDPLYQLTTFPNKADSSTVRKDFHFQYSTINQTGGYDHPLGTSIFSFKIENNTTSKLRFDTSGMFFECYIQNAAGNANPIDAVPAWNSIPYKIGSLSLTFNNGGTKVFSKLSNDYIHFWNATTLRMFSMEELDKRGDMIFTPMGSSEYSIAKANHARYDPFLAKDVNGTPIPLVDASLIRINTAAADLAGAVAVPYAVAVASARTLAHVGGPQKARSDNYNMTAANAFMRPVIMFIPFCVLFGGFDGIPNNLINGEISMSLNLNPMEYFGTASSGRFIISKVWLGLDTYSPSQEQIVSMVAQKESGKPDLMSYIDCNVRSVVINGTGQQNLDFTGIKNLHSVMIYQVAKGLPTGTSANAQTYTSCGEFFIGNHYVLEANDDTVNVERSDHIFDAEHPCPPIDNIYIEYENINYPSTPIKTTVVYNANANKEFEGSSLYHEYLRVLGKMPFDNVKSSFVSYDTFKRTMPFIYLTPWSTNGMHRTDESKSLKLHFTIADARTETFMILINTYKTIQINRDSTVQIYE